MLNEILKKEEEELKEQLEAYKNVFVLSYNNFVNFNMIKGALQEIRMLRTLIRRKEDERNE